MSFRDEIRSGKVTNTKEGLEKYLQYNTEWTWIEFKKESNFDKFNFRKAVCAIANTNGGELIIGSNDKRKAEGTIEKLEDIQDILKQVNAPPKDGSIEYITDLLSLIREPQTVSFTENGTTMYCHALIISSPGILAFAFDDNKKVLTPYHRDGSKSVPMTNLDVLRWIQKNSRAKILKGLYEEIKSMSEKVSIGDMLPQNAYDMELPSFKKIQESGLIFLTDQDKEILFGKRLPTGTVIGDVYRTFNEIKAQIDDVKGLPIETWQKKEKIRAIISQEKQFLNSPINIFKEYLKKQGIIVL